MLTPEQIRAVIAHFETELAKLPVEEKKEEPKLRHGDYGYDEENTSRLICDLRAIDEKQALSSRKNGHWSSLAHKPLKVKLGNIFDDLAALQEDVEEFDYRGDGSFPFHGEIHRPNRIWLRIVSNSSMYDIKETEEIILKLRQMVATAKREQIRLSQLCGDG